VNKVTFTSQDKECIRHQFDAFCTIVLKYAARNIYRERKRRAQREVSLSDVDERQFEQLAYMDDAIMDAQRFTVLGYDIAIKSELLAEAVRHLPEARRDILLLYYFLGMNDREIGEALGLIRGTVHYQRTSALKRLRRILEEIRNEEI
jgi:RNA polymerase sigma factor (sigma-70 family)